MNIDVNAILATLASEIGILPAVIIIALMWAYWQERKRSDSLSRELRDVSKETAESLTRLSSLISGGRA